MYLFERIPKAKYNEVLFAVKNRNYTWLKNICEKHDVIPESCGGCGSNRVDFWNWFDWAVSEKIFNER